jgi:hypothetical protein
MVKKGEECIECGQPAIFINNGEGRTIYVRKGKINAPICILCWNQYYAGDKNLT